MKNSIIVLLIAIFMLSCKAQPDPTRFSEDALNDTFVNLEGESVSLKTILNKHKGETIVIDIWASWCRDCIVGMPNLKALQNEYADATYLFISMDKSQKSWKNGIEKYNITGEHYFMPKGWKSQFSKSIDLDWVPRYMVINAEGQIALFRAIKAEDSTLKNHLK
ncbi:TlpA family protein disulfide reductase [Psychroserpens algicola]|uniref:TlpA family protein disulfide reductase n=1 Tax=Psychroserpens algicola TaxID=1719034 RepID=UPI001952C154|nr:TlpA disulfide reductase family protein [Psychroserpens algicola]